MEFAENLALDHRYEKDLGTQLKKPPNDGGFHYYNAKKINEICDENEEMPEYDRYLRHNNLFEVENEILLLAQS